MSLLSQALVFLAAAAICLPLSKRFGLGVVVGYLVAGLIIGPQVLGLIPSAEDVLHFSELGIVLFLFLVGLELQPKKVWGLRHELGISGGLQMLLCTLGLAVFFAFFLTKDIRAFLLLGFSVALSSTALVLTLLREKTFCRQRGGKSRSAF